MSAAVEDRFIPQRHDGWVRDIEQPLPTAKTAYERALRELLVPSASMLYRNLHKGEAPLVPALKTMRVTVAIDAPDVSMSPKSRLCDWGGVNDEFIMWTPSNGTVFARHMRTRAVRPVVTLDSHVRGVRWTPDCTAIGVASDMGVIRVDPVASCVVWRCRVLGAMATVAWCSNHVVAACGVDSGVALCDTRAGGTIALNLPTTPVRIMACTDRGVAVASGNSVSVYDVRKCSFSHPVVTRHYSERVAALDWRPQSLAVGTEGGSVSALRQERDVGLGHVGLGHGGRGLVGIAWDPPGRSGITTLSRESNLVSHGGPRGMAIAYCVATPLYLIHNGDRTRVAVVTAIEAALVFEVHETKQARLVRNQVHGLVR